jgi:hypothetical protein
MSCPKCPHCQERAAARAKLKDERLAWAEVKANTPNGTCRACGIPIRVTERPRLCRRCWTTDRETNTIDLVLMAAEAGYRYGYRAQERRSAILQAADAFCAAHGIGVVSIAAGADTWLDFDEPYVEPAP